MSVADRRAADVAGRRRVVPARSRADQVDLPLKNRKNAAARHVLAEGHRVPLDVGSPGPVLAGPRRSPVFQTVAGAGPVDDRADQDRRADGSRRAASISSCARPRCVRVDVGAVLRPDDEVGLRLPARPPRRRRAARCRGTWLSSTARRWALNVQPGPRHVALTTAATVGRRSAGGQRRRRRAAGQRARQGTARTATADDAQPVVRRGRAAETGERDRDGQQRPASATAKRDQRCAAVGGQRGNGPSSLAEASRPTGSRRGRPAAHASSATHSAADQRPPPAAGTSPAAAPPSSASAQRLEDGEGQPRRRADDAGPRQQQTKKASPSTSPSQQPARSAAAARHGDSASAAEDAEPRPGRTAGTTRRAPGHRDGGERGRQSRQPARDGAAPAAAAPACTGVADQAASPRPRAVATGSPPAAQAGSPRRAAACPETRGPRRAGCLAQDLPSLAGPTLTRRARRLGHLACGRRLAMHGACRGDAAARTPRAVGTGSTVGPSVRGRRRLPSAGGLGTRRALRRRRQRPMSRTGVPPAAGVAALVDARIRRARRPVRAGRRLRRSPPRSACSDRS